MLTAFNVAQLLEDMQRLCGIFVEQIYESVPEIESSVIVDFEDAVDDFVANTRHEMSHMQRREDSNKAITAGVVKAVV